MATCFWCNSSEAKHEVEEVWFDFGEPVMRFCSSKELYPKDAPRPHMCEEHKKPMAHAVSSAVLQDAVKAGATGPLWPTRWWVKYADGHVIGGDVGPQPKENPT